MTTTNVCANCGGICLGRPDDAGHTKCARCGHSESAMFHYGERTDPPEYSCSHEPHEFVEKLECDECGAIRVPKKVEAATP